MCGLRQVRWGTLWVLVGMDGWFLGENIILWGGDRGGKCFDEDGGRGTKTVKPVDDNCAIGRTFIHI